METIEAKGHNGTVYFDGRSIRIVREGFLARASVGKGEKRIPLHSVTGVQWKEPGIMANGFIAFTIPGGNEKNSRFGSATMDATKDENAVIVTRKQKAAFVELREAIERAMYPE
jgi:hypothetical protein